MQNSSNAPTDSSQADNEVASQEEQKASVVELPLADQDNRRMPQEQR